MKKIIGLILKLSFSVPERIRINPGDVMAFVYASLKNDKLTNDAHNDCEKIPPFRIKQIVHKKDVLEVRIAFLSEETAHHFYEAVIKTGLTIKTKSYPLLEGRGETALRLPDQWRQMQPRSSIILDFQTPTFFRRGKIDMPLPVPVSVWGSVLRNVTLYTGLTFPEHIFKDMEEYILIHRLQNVNTASVQANEVIRRAGFTGQVEFRLYDKAPLYLGQVLNLLTEWVQYSGCGAKTAYGFGSVEILPSWVNGCI